MKKSLLVLFYLLFMSNQLAFADSWFSSKKGVKPVKNKLYKEECGSCHFSYQAGLLPEKSWKKMMLTKSLENHFGENAELDKKDQASLLQYLIKNSADKSSYKRSKKVMSSLRSGEAPLRITKVRYIQKKHREIPKKMIQGNLKVKTLGNCSACHTKASEGSFDDDSVYIPNYGRWDD